MFITFREWFALNRSLVLFVYGQVFFVLGLAIILQSRQRSRLKLAHSLPWLAGFGLLHGLNEWGDFFIPIQAQYLNSVIINLLNVAQLVLLAASFVCLFQFGVELLRPWPQNWRWVRFSPALLFSIWLIGPLWIGLLMSSDVTQWQAEANALARYLLCVPGGFLAGYGLHRQVQEQIRTLRLKPIERTLNVAAGALVAYGVLGGLIVPAAPIFPATVLNVDTFTQLFILPPPVFRSLAGLILAVAIIRALEVFNLETERLIHHMEEDLMISMERERMARELHDGALQQVYAAGLLAQSLYKRANDSMTEGLEQLVITINRSITQLRTFLEKSQSTIEHIELVPALETIVDDARRLLPVEMRWKMKRTLHLAPEQINHLMAFTREALSNAIRHADTDRLEISLACADGRLHLTIRDFGRGLPENPEPGYGLRNMRDRARLLDAVLYFKSAPGKGTAVTLDMPLERNP